MQAIKDVIPGVITKLKNPQALRQQQIMTEWPAIAGETVASHTKPSLMQNGKLYVWVDQSALAFELNQKHRQSILKRAQAILGEEVVKEVRIRVGQIR